jgi:hypothetical protein
MLVALLMEGKFSGEGLQSLDADEDLMCAMARELVEKAGVGESADAIWQQLDRERSKHTATVPTAEDGRQNIEPASELVVQAEPAFEASIHLVHSGSRKKRKNAPPWPTTTTTGGSFSSACSAEPAMFHKTAIVHAWITAKGGRKCRTVTSPGKRAPTIRTMPVPAGADKTV